MRARSRGWTIQARHLFPALLAASLVGTAVPAGAVADGEAPQRIATHRVFGGARAVGNTLMEHDGTTNFALRVGGSQATIPASEIPPDGTVVRAFLFWSGSTDPNSGVDRDVDFELPSGAFFNNLSVDVPTAGETLSPWNRCVSRLAVGDTPVEFFSCRREITHQLQGMGAGAATGTYTVSDVDALAGDCDSNFFCQAMYAGWALVVMWESPTHSVRRDLVLFDAFLALDEQQTGFSFSSGISAEFQLDQFTVGPTTDAELTVVGFEGDAQLGVPPQNAFPPNSPLFCNTCDDFLELRRPGGTRVRLQDGDNRPGNLFNGTNNQGGAHPGLDIDTFDIGSSGLNVIQPGDTRVFLRAGSGDGLPGGGGGGGELFFLGPTLLSLETFSPRFSNAFTEKEVIESVAGPGEVINYLLRVENDGSAPSTQTVLKDQLPAGVTYVSGTTTSTCNANTTDINGNSRLLTAQGLSIGTLAAGQRCEVRFKGRIGAGVASGTVLQNFFTVESAELPPLQVGPAVTTVEAAELGQPTKRVSVASGGAPTPGATLLYVIRVPNTGTRDAPAVRVEDLLPPELAFQSFVSLPPQSTNNSDTATGHIDISDITVSAGSHAEISFLARIRAGTAAGTLIENQASVSQPSLPSPLLTDDPDRNVAPPDPTLVEVESDISLSASSKSVLDTDGAPTVPGDVLEYRIRIAQAGGVTTTVIVADDLPPFVEGCTITQLPPGAFGNCQPGGANGTGRIEAVVPVPAGQTRDVVFQVSVQAGAPDGATLINQASLTPVEDDTSAVTVTSPPVEIFARPIFTSSTKAVLDQNGGDPRPGDALTWTVTVRNTGPVAASNVVVSDTVDPSLESITPLDGGSLSGGVVTWTLATLAPGASAQLRFTSGIRQGVANGTVVRNVALVEADAPSDPFETPPVTLEVRAEPDLLVRKSVVDLNGPPFEPGDPIRYEIRLENNGDGAATDVRVRDPIDPSLTNVSLPAGGSLVGDEVLFESSSVSALATLAPGDVVTLLLEAELETPLADGTRVSNQATVRGVGLPVPVLSDDPATPAVPNDPTDFLVESQAALAMTKTFVDLDGGALMPGDQVEFTLTVTSTGNAPATGVEVRDPLDPRLTFVSSASGGQLVGDDVVFTSAGAPGLAEVRPDEPVQLRFVADIAFPLADGTTIDNQAQASSPVAATAPSDDPTTPAPGDPTTLVVESRPVLDSFTKVALDVDGDGVFEPGDLVRYILVLENSGSEPATNVVIDDPLPAELTSLTVLDGGALAGNVASWTLPSLDVGESVTLRVEGVLERPLADQTVVSNHARARADGVAPVASDDPVTASPDDATAFTVRSHPRLVVQKAVVDDNGPPFEPGDLLHYRLLVRNEGGRAAVDVTLSDPLDPNLVDVTPHDGGVLSGTVLTYSASGNGALASLDVDEEVELRFDARIRLPLDNGTLILNQASARVGEGGVPGQPFLSDDPTTPAPTDPTRVQVVSASDLTATTLESLDEAGAVIERSRPGELVVYSLVVRNAGSETARDVRVRIPVPPELNVEDAAGGVIAPGEVTFSATGVAALAELEPGQEVALSVRSRVVLPLDDGTVIALQAEILEDGLVAAVLSDDPSTAAVGDATLVTIESAPDLERFEKRFVDTDGAPVEPGDEIQYVLTVRNEGDAVARDVVVRDALPDELELVGSPDGGRLVGGVVVFDTSSTPALAAVAPGELQLRMLVRVRDDVDEDTEVANQATLSAEGVTDEPSDDPTTDAVDDPTVFIVETVPRAALDKSLTTPTGTRIVAPGEVLLYTLRVRSVGTAALGATTLEDTLPLGLSDVVPGPGLSYEPGTRRVSATLTSLAPGEERTFTLQARVAEGTANGTRLENQARLLGDDIEQVLSDDPDTPAATDPTVALVEAAPNLSTSAKVALDLNGAPLLPGDLVRYTLTVTNTGNGAAVDVRVRDPIDTAALDVVSIGQGGALSGQDVLWTAASTPALASVAAGGSVQLTFEARVRAGVDDGTAIANQATLLARDLEPDALTDDPGTPAPGDPTVVTVRSPVLRFSKRFVDLDGTEAVRPGDAVRYELVVTNDGSAPANDLVVTDPVPEGLVELSVLDGGALSGSEARWTVGSLPAGQAVTLRLEARVDPLSAGGTVLENQASASSDELSAPVLSDDPDTDAPDDATRRVVEADEDYEGVVELFDEESGAPIAAPVLPGQRVRARITFQNTATQTGQGGVLRVPYNPLRFVLEDASDGGIIDHETREARWDASLNEGLFRELPPGEERVLETVGRVVSPVPDGSLIEVAAHLQTASASETWTFGPATMTVRSRPALSASTKEVIDDNGGLVEPGDVLTYRLTVLNDGGAAAQQLVVTDGVPAGTVYLPGSTTVAGAPVADAGGESPLAGGLALDTLGAGRSLVITFQVRVDLSALRGLVISNQAVLRADGVSDAVTDNPSTPLVAGDATVVVVGGGPALVISKRGAPSPASLGAPVRFEVAVENAGSGLVQDLFLRDPIEAPGAYVPNTLTLDGTPVTDADDDDGVTVRAAGGAAIELRRDVLEAGDGFVLGFDVVAESGSRIRNQAELVASGLTPRLSDGDPAVPGAQPTIIALAGTGEILVDEATTELEDGNGGLLEAGDPLRGRTVLKNRSLTALEVTQLRINLSALFELDEEALDSRLVFDASTRIVSLRPGTDLVLEPGDAVTLGFTGAVRSEAVEGDVVRAVADAVVRAVDSGTSRGVDLGRGSLTVGLLEGTGALAGTLFFESGPRDGAFDPQRDERAVGFSVMAFPASQRDGEPVRSAVTGEDGRFRLLPLPAGDWRVEVRSSSGALFATHDLDGLGDGELREEDLRIEPSGSVYNSHDFSGVRGSRVWLYVDDGDGNAENDTRVPDDQLSEGQQGQRTTSQGLYRFDAPPGAYRIGLEPSDALLTFPSTRILPLAGGSGDPLGAVAELDDSKVVVPHALPDDGLDRTYFLRFENDEEGPTALNNHIPIDRLQDQVRITKTANRRRLTVGDLVAYTVRVENRSSAAISLADGGVELVDSLPEAFRLVDGSWRLDRIEVDESGQQRRFEEQSASAEGKRIVRFGPFPLQAGAIWELRYQVVVGPGAPRGDAENRARLRAAAGQVPLSDVATARVRVEADPLFDLGSIRAKVYCDDDGDGWQDPGERGVPGARVYLDTGHYGEADITGKLHFSLVPPGMHLVKIDERTLPPGVELLADSRRNVYLSAGLPAQVSFQARCRTERITTPEILVNEDAFSGGGLAGAGERVVAIKGHLGPQRLFLDDVELAALRADLGVAAEGEEPSFGSTPGPNLGRPRQGVLPARLVFVPRVQTASSVVGWQLTVERDGEGDREPVYVFAGDGLPPDRLAWDGKDEASGALLLEEGGRYGAVFAVVVEGGDEAYSPVRPFGVAFGAEPDDAEAPASEPLEDRLDASGGPLFKGQEPTKRLTSWLKEMAKRARERPGAVEVRVHADAQPGEAVTARTAQQAKAVARVLEEAGVAPGRLSATGEGDTKPLRPNLRERDRLANRRVEVRVAPEAGALQAVASRGWPAEVRVNGEPVSPAEDGSVAAEYRVQVGSVLAVDMTAQDGGRLKIMRRVPEGDFAAASSEAGGAGAPVGLEGSFAEGALRVAGRDVGLGLLDVAVGADRHLADGSLFVQAGGGATFLPRVPEGREWARWRLRVIEGPREPAAERAPDGGPAPEDGGPAPSGRERSAEAGNTLRELSGEGAPPAQVEWDGEDRAGKSVTEEGARFYIRLILETTSGEGSISPDVLATAASSPAAGPAGAPADQVLVEDALDEETRLKPAARAALEEAARRLGAAGGASGEVRVEVHTDDTDGSRSSRRPRTQRVAEEVKALLVAAGVDESRVAAVGVGSDEPRMPNLNPRARRQNRRVVVTLRSPSSQAAPTRAAGEPGVRANGRDLEVAGERFAGEVPATRSGEVTLMLRSAEGARALVRLRPQAGEVWQGAPAALGERVASRMEPPPLLEPADEGEEADAGPEPDTDGGEADGGQPADVAVAEASPLVPYPEEKGEPPAWWPTMDRIPAAELEVELPPDGEKFRARKLVVRGKTKVGNRVRIGTEEVLVDPATGAFEHLVTLPDGDSELVVEATDSMGNRARVRRLVAVDSSGWFALVLADTAFGGDGARLSERTPYTSLTLGDFFVYGRGVAYVKGNWGSDYVFKDYDLTLHLDTSRWQEEAWARDLLNPDLVYPVWGDSSLEVQDANARFPLYMRLKADHSTLTVGNVRPSFAGGDLFRYQRARYGASLELDRGWSEGLDMSKVEGEAPAPAADPWRTRVGAFATGGDTRERHARAELMGTGGAVYFLRHELVIEGSERVSVIVRDGVTGAEIARRPMARNVDYSMRYSEGRVLLMEPLPAFTDASFTVNHNLGQVSTGHRVFLEVEYDHRDAEAFMGFAGGSHASQVLFGHLEVGGGYVYEGREDGQPGYQLGGAHAKLFLDDVTWLKAEWAMSQNVDAGNFLSMDGGLTYETFGQSLDEKSSRVGRVVFPTERQGHAYKVEGQVGFGHWLGRTTRDGVVHAYAQRLSPGFFAGASILEQGQTKWGADGAWRITDNDLLRLRYDGIIAEVPEQPHIDQARELQRQIVTAQYQRRILKTLSGGVEYGYGYTHDSGSFGQTTLAQPRDFHTNVGALSLDWAALEKLSLGMKQEVIFSGDPNQLLAWNDHLVTHATARYSLTENLALTATESIRWSGENQTTAGISWKVNEQARVYANERFGFARGGFTNSTVVGGETQLTDSTKAYAEYQLQSAFSTDQSRGVVGLHNRFKLPFGLTLQAGYERVQTFGGIVQPTEAGNVPPGAFTDGTFYAAPGANGGGNFFYGAGSRDAGSVGLEWLRPGIFLGSQRFELRYDNFDETRGGRDRVWMLSMTNAELKLSPSLALLGRFNVGLAQDLSLGKREAYLEEDIVGLSYRPVTHDWFSVLTKLSRRVDNRPLSLLDGRFEDYTIHAAAIEPIVELPFQLQLVEKLALKHVSQVLDDLPRADAWTLLWINRVNWHALGSLRAFDLDPLIPGEIDLGVEYRVLAGITAARIEHGALLEVQYAPVAFFRVGVGYNFTHFSDQELARDDQDYSGFFIRGVGQF